MPASARVALLVVAAAAGVNADLPYAFGDDFPITELTDDNFDSLVTNDSGHMWVVEFYADWCGHCKSFANGYEKAAANLKGLVKFGAVNSDKNAKKTAAKFGVQGFPTTKVFLPEVSRNPYTGEMMKIPIDYTGPHSAKGVVSFVTNKMPSTVVAVTDASLSKFIDGKLPKAILLTKKTETSTLLKSLSLLLDGRMVVGEARDTQENVVKKFGATDFPALFVITADGGQLPYSGEMKPEAVSTFLLEHAGPEPEAGGAPEIVEEVTASNYAEVVEDSTDAWLLIFGTLPAPGGNGLAEAIYGQAKVGKVVGGDASFAKKFGVKGEEAALVLVPYGSKSNLKKFTKFETSESGVAAAKKAVLDTLSSDKVTKLHQANVDQWMASNMAKDGHPVEAQAVAILFSDKPSVPALFRSVSLQFNTQLAFGMVQSDDSAMMQRFNIDKAPALLVLFPQEADKGDPAKEGGMQLGGMRYTPKQHGPFKFGYVANFMSQLIKDRLQMLGKASPENPGFDPTKNMPSPKKGKAAGPLPELSSSSFEDACANAGGLCAIAMLDGSKDNTNKQGHLDMLTAMRKKRQGGPLSFSWLDATCHTSFAAAFNIYETDLPTMVVYSPSKGRWARSIGAFDAESLGSFGTGVATGRIRTEDIKDVPALEEIDCATLPRGADAVIEEEPLDDDFMAEILEEERKAREEREAAAAANKPDEPAKPSAKDKAKMSKLERLEAEIETCGSMDLLCSARREKQVKAFEKQRDLEDKLREIAEKKKKKKKKAKKKA